MKRFIPAAPLMLLAAAALAADTPAGSSTKPDDVAAALKAARGVALVEVTAVVERDNRPSDGNWTATISFKTLKSSGKIPADIQITLGYGGRRLRPAPEPSGPLVPNPLEKGGRYWLLFNEEDAEKYPQGVVAWYPEKSVPAAVEAAAGKAAAGDVAAVLKAATAVALIDVTGVKEEDQRPADGPLLEVVSYKVEKSSGKVPAELRILKAPPYPQMPGIAPAPVPAGPLNPNPLKAGQKYWVVFNRAESDPYRNGVIAVYAEKDAPPEVPAAAAAEKFGK